MLGAPLWLPCTPFPVLYPIPSPVPALYSVPSAESQYLPRRRRWPDILLPLSGDRRGDQRPGGGDSISARWCTEIVSLVYELSPLINAAGSPDGSRHPSRRGRTMPRGHRRAISARAPASSCPREEQRGRSLNDVRRSSTWNLYLDRQTNMLSTTSLSVRLTSCCGLHAEYRCLQYCRMIMIIHPYILCHLAVSCW